MSDIVQTFAWHFGGPLAGLSAALAWTLLGGLTVLGLVWIVVSYRRTLVLLPPTRRRTLTSLRLLLWLGLMLALAGPTRVERTYAKHETRPLAVLVDRSDSMTTPDNRGQRRLDDALRRWRQIAPAANETFGPPHAFAFAGSSAAVDSTEHTPALDTGTTRLFDSLNDIIAQAPAGGWGGVVLLTDGLDTSDREAAPALDNTIRAALAAGVPVYPLSGYNRYSGRDFITLRDLALPARVPPRSDFTFELTLDTFQPQPRRVPVRLRVGDQWRETEHIPLAAGRRALAWSATLPARDEGLLPIELVVGEGKDAVTARAEVRVATPDTTRILYYQGALDWGYRFLADILRRDPAFHLTPIFNLAPIGARTTTPTPAGALPDLPDTVHGLNAYDVVVLANATADQFSAVQQNALADWVRDGGILLFLAPDDASARGYVGTELEKMLPVVFGHTDVAPTVDRVQETFRQRMKAVGGARTSLETPFAEYARQQSEHPELTAFSWEPAAATIFGTEQPAPAPLFHNHATVAAAKPGATVLARHPVARAPEGDERAILLALQRYGRGQSAVFTSDALWRWKLNQDSAERHVEKFWQNLFAWLGRERPRGPRFERAPLLGRTAQEIEFRLLGGGPDAPHLSVEKTGSAEATLLSAAGEHANARLYRWTPPAAGEWLISAADDKGRTIRHWIQILDTPDSAETSGLPPDDSLLQTLAQRTGGGVLGGDAPATWRAAGQAAELLRETRHPLWHAAGLIILLLFLYVLELILRRRWQLL